MAKLPRDSLIYSRLPNAATKDQLTVPCSIIYVCVPGRFLVTRREGNKLLEDNTFMEDESNWKMVATGREIYGQRSYNGMYSQITNH